MRELALELNAEGIAPTGEAIERMRRLSPGAVSRSVLLRPSRLPREAAVLASAASVLCSGAALRHAATLAGLNQSDARATADALAGAGIPEPGQPLRFTRPLLAGVIYEDLPSGRRAAEQKRAAEILQRDNLDAGLVAAHLLRCDPWVGAQLRAAAASEVGHGASEVAIALLRRALAEPPAMAARPELIYELGRAEVLVLNRPRWRTSSRRCSSARTPRCGHGSRRT